MSKLTLTFIVNGEEVHVEAAPEDYLHVVVLHVLEKSKNTGRPPEEWELRKEDGTPIPDLKLPVYKYNLVNFTKLYLSLKVGAGG